MSTIDVLLWDAYPYVAIAVFLVGTWWRYRYDKFGWTTRSSQLYERSLLRIASPLFHFGLLAVVGGHVIGLLIPESWTASLGISENGYHLMAVTTGGVAGLVTLTGLVMLIYRRRTSGPVFSATTKNDKTMYVFLAGAILLGILATLAGAGVLGDSYNYRETVSIWFRSLFVLHPQGALMAGVPLAFKVHVLAGLTLFLIWPFTRLVHAFSAPIGYVFRPYILYRSRAPHEVGSRPARRGWERIGS